MLKNIDPVLSADLLWVLDSMGHGDDLALVDANHPAESVAACTISKRLVRLPGLSMERVARAILSVYPLDEFVPDPVRRMHMVDDPVTIPNVQASVQLEIDKAAGKSLKLVGIERYAFYAAAKQAFAVVQVGDARAYGCFLFRKGVIATELGR